MLGSERIRQHGGIEAFSFVPDCNKNSFRGVTATAHANSFARIAVIAMDNGVGKSLAQGCLHCEFVLVWAAFRRKGAP